MIPFVVSLFGTLAEEILACESAEEIASLMRNSEI